MTLILSPENTLLDIPNIATANIVVEILATANNNTKQ
jgi:hypothetical protein